MRKVTKKRLGVALAATCVALTSIVVMATQASATSVTSVTATADSYLSGNTLATWTIGFTPTSGGALVAGNAIRVDFPAGVFTVTGASATLVSGFTGSCATPSVTTTGTTVIIQLTSSCALAASTAATLTITGVSPSFNSTNFNQFSVTTYGDTTTGTPIDGSGGHPTSGALNFLATVTYDTHASNGATATSGAAPTDGSSPYDASATTVTVLGNTGSLTLTGYTFAGWCTTNNAANPTLCTGTHYNAAATFTIAGNTTLYSQWTAVTYTVTYSTLTSQGTSTSSGTAPTDGSSPYTSGSTVTVLGNTGSLTLTGYTFAGWCTTNNAANPTLCTGTHYNAAATFTIAGNTTLYSQWTATSYTVTYAANSNSLGSPPVDTSSPYAPGATVTVRASGNLTCATGYSFSGWNTAANGSGTAYSASGSATFTISGNTTLYAQCTAVPPPPPPTTVPPTTTTVQPTTTTTDAPPPATVSAKTTNSTPAPGQSVPISAPSSGGGLAILDSTKPAAAVMLPGDGGADVPMPAPKITQNANGSITVEVTVPPSTPPGVYIIAIVGTDSRGVSRAIVVPVVVRTKPRGAAVPAEVEPTAAASTPAASPAVDLRDARLVLHRSDGRPSRPLAAAFVVGLAGGVLLLVRRRRAALSRIGR